LTLVLKIDFIILLGGDFMGSFGGFYKGDKKKQKKEKQVKNNNAFGSAPVFTMPEVIGRKKKDY
jgi:hypothetical protein